MQISEALDLYLVQLRADGRSQHTIAQARRHVRLFVAWLGDRPVDDVRHEDVARFLASDVVTRRADGATRKATSANALRSSLRSFCRHVHDAGYTRSNAGRLIRRALCGAPPPRALSDDEQVSLLRALSEGAGPHAQRDRALITLMLGSGIRLGSALALEKRDVDLERSELALRHTKGNIPTSLPLSRAVGDHLRRYLEGRGDGPLFTGRNGRAIGGRHVQRRLALWCRRAEIERRIAPHDLRHTFAIGLYRRTRDILLVQHALRHRSISSTTVYARCEDGRLREALSSQS